MSNPGIALPWPLLRAVLRPAPVGLTPDQLRSDLSHETAAKLARLAGISKATIYEWRERYGGGKPD